MLLTINAGSSSVRFALHEPRNGQRPLLHGMLERIGLPGTTLSVCAGAGTGVQRMKLRGRDDAIPFLLRWIERRDWFASVDAIGHRVVHGMDRTRPARVNPPLLAELREVVAFDPEHLPRELQLMQAFLDRHPRLPQFACFDTAFHARMPQLAQCVAVPRRLAARGVRRYGFHGLSYSYLMQELATLDRRAARGRVILAHLGNGASLAAVRNGRPIDTTMGFTPASGVVMGTRCGDLDPGLPYFLARTEKLSPPRIQRLLNHESGLLGVSGISSDLRDLLTRAGRDPRAAEAIELFCYQIVKAVGALTATLGGLDTLVFSAGIGEHSPAIRARICRALAFLEVRLNGAANRANAAVISTPASAVTVRVMATNEELMIARAVAELLKQRNRT